MFIQNKKLERSDYYEEDDRSGGDHTTSYNTGLLTDYALLTPRFPICLILKLSLSPINQQSFKNIKLKYNLNYIWTPNVFYTVS